MHTVQSLAELPELGIERVALTCGVFDGLHRGHQELIRTAREAAARTNAAPVVFTFDPHPAQVLSPEHVPQLLMSPEHKLAMLAELGVAATVLLPFTRETAAIEAEPFLQDHIFGAGPTVTSVVVGEHWRFGYRAEGTVETMRMYGETVGAEVVGVAELEVGGAVISSTRIRQALRDGDLVRAKELLGRPFSVLGEVCHGRGVGGSELRYPTANVRTSNEVFPPPGIYAATARVWEDEVRGAAMPGVLYRGDAPTFEDAVPQQAIVEMHIFDYDGDLYGRRLEVSFDGFVRADARFDSVEALIAQIGRDVKAARRLHAQKHA